MKPLFCRISKFCHKGRLQMGAKCCCFRKKSAKNSVLTLDDYRRESVTDVRNTAREEIRDNVVPSEPALPRPTFESLEIGEIIELVNRVSQGETSITRVPPADRVQESVPSASLGETSNTKESNVTLVQESLPSASLGEIFSFRELAENIVQDFVPSATQGETSSIIESPISLAQESVPSASLGETSRFIKPPESLVQEYVPSESLEETSSITTLSANLVQESVPSASQGETSSVREPSETLVQDESICYRASNILWQSGSFFDPIPNGFYSVIPDDRLDHLQDIPTLDELHAMSKADAILVDLEDDVKIKHIQQLIKTMAKGANSTPDQIKKIVQVVTSVHTSPTASFHGVRKLGHIRRASCHSRALWFKVLADTIGLECNLVRGVPSHLMSSKEVSSFNHMSVVVEHNNKEYLVDLTLAPGRLIPLSSIGVYMVHISATRDGSCALPMRPNSFMDSDHERALRLKSRSTKKKEQVNDDSSSQSSQNNVSGSHLGDARDQDGNNSQSLENKEPSHQEVIQMWNAKFPNKPLSGDYFIDSSDLTIGNQVGKGCFGEVFRGMWNEKEVAIKRFAGQELTNENKIDFWTETFNLSRLQHPNVVQFLGVCARPLQLSLVTEYIKRGSLYDVLRKEGRYIIWPMKLKILGDICRGMKYIHEIGIVHRDLKTANCLLANDWTVKICDFGLSRVIGETMVENTIAGTAGWIAPEVLRKKQLTAKSDIYSFGVIMWELCTLSEPWKGVPRNEIMKNVAWKGAKLEIPDGPLSKLIADCWLEPPEKRPSCDEILTYLETCAKNAEPEQGPESLISVSSTL